MDSEWALKHSIHFTTMFSPGKICEFCLYLIKFITNIVFFFFLSILMETFHSWNGRHCVKIQPTSKHSEKCKAFLYCHLKL